MNRLQVAVVGAGALGRHHARILSTLPGVELVAVAELNETAGRAVAEACQTRWVPDYRVVAAELDAVVLATPTSSHHRIARDLLLAGIDLFVEKPLTASVSEARELVELARCDELVLQVGHVERFNPGYVAARPAIRDPKYIRTERVSPYAFRSTDIGVVHDMLIHDLDLVLDLVGETPCEVSALGITILGGHEDAVQARLRFPGGCVADLVANRVSPVTQRTLQAWSPTGCATIDFGTRDAQVFARSPALMYGAGPLERARQPGVNIEALKAEVFGHWITVEPLSPQTRDQLTAELLDFERACRTREAPQVDGAAGLRAVEVAEAVLESVAAHQWDGTATGRIGPQAEPGQRELRRAG